MDADDATGNVYLHGNVKGANGKWAKCRFVSSFRLLPFCCVFLQAKKTMWLLRPNLDSTGVSVIQVLQGMARSDMLNCSNGGKLPNGKARLAYPRRFETSQNTYLRASFTTLERLNSLGITPTNAISIHAPVVKQDHSISLSLTHLQISAGIRNVSKL